MGLFDNVIVGGLVLGTIGGLAWAAIDGAIEKKAEKEKQEKLAEAERQRITQMEMEKERKHEEEEQMRRYEEIKHRIYVVDQERLKKIRLEEQRRNFPCCFSQNFSYEDFRNIVNTVSHRMRKRLSVVSMHGTIIHGRIYSQSGISHWDFELDFNDFGEVTGQYWWISTCNHCESIIPDSFADQVKEEIENRLSANGRL